MELDAPVTVISEVLLDLRHVDGVEDFALAVIVVEDQLRHVILMFEVFFYAHVGLSMDLLLPLLILILE